MRRVWPATAAAAMVAGALVLVVATRSSSPPVTRGPIRTSFEHSVVGFGDPVHARAVIVLEAGVAATARVNANVAPLAELEPVRVTRVTSRGLVSLTYDVDAVCIFDECVGNRGRKVVHLADVTVTGPDGDVIASAPWPPLDVRGRVTAADLEPTDPPLKTDVTPAPVEYRIAPHTLATLLTLLAALLAVAGVGLAGSQVAAIQHARAARAAPLTELERALALAREAESRAAPDRRRALALLERLLGPRDERLSREARRLAWSPPPPEAEALDELVTEVESKVGR